MKRNIERFPANFMFDLTEAEITLRTSQIPNELLFWKALIEQKQGEQNHQILIAFAYLKQFEETKQQLLEQKERPLIGFKTRKNNASALIAGLI